ncbi:MAG TPA: hypothetical protein VGA37_08565 [Gemmatimonadales bacterium]
MKSYLLLFVLCAAACAGPTPQPGPPPVSDAPAISRLEPTTGPAGTGYPVRVIIHGRRFHPTENLVAFGPVRVPHLPSTDGGTRITFFAPKEVPSSGEVPPMPLLPERYAVTVTTERGSSDTTYFTLTRAGGGP